MQQLFTTIREACSAAVWSRGVELSRADAVVRERSSDTEIELRVATQGGLITFAVTLWPSEEDWSCECNNSDDVCVHVAAAVIAVRRAQADGRSSLTSAKVAPGRIGYRFIRQDGALALHRCLRSETGETPLTSTLTALAGSGGVGPRVVAAQSDIEIERTLATHLRSVLPKALLPKLLKQLIDHPDVRLDGQPVRVQDASPLLVAYVDDRNDGFLLHAKQDPHIDEIMTNGAVRMGDTLRPLVDPGLTQQQLEDLRGGRVFRANEVHTLVADVLPALIKKRIPVDIRTSRLPQIDRTATPRIMLDVTQHQHISGISGISGSSGSSGSISVLATLVYGDPPIARIDGDTLVLLGDGTGDALPARDLREEDRVRSRLDRLYGLRIGIRAELDASGAIALTETLKRAPLEVRGDALRRFFMAPPLRPRLSVGADDFSLTFETDADVSQVASDDDPAGPRASPAARAATAAAGDVLRAWQHGETMVPLLEGGFAPLPADWLSRYGRTLADLLAARAATTDRLPKSALPDLARLCDAMQVPRPAALGMLSQLVDGFTALPAAALPSDLRAELRCYQRRGVDWLSFLGNAELGGLLADDMGLGKTLQALCAARGRTLVVAPTSVLHNWLAEIERFRPALRPCVYHGAARRLSDDADIVLTTYAVLRLDAEALTQTDWDTLILDEAQNIKNPSSQVARAAFGLRGKFRVTLSGTPVENRLEELWSQLHFTNPGMLGTLQDFQERYAKPIASGQEGAAAALRQRIAPFVLRRLKHEVAPELPARTEVVLRCDLTTAERETYEAIHAATRQDVLDKLAAGGSVLAALEALLRLRQACCHRGLLPGQSAARQEPSSKLRLLLETLDQAVAEGHKALVFSQWTSLLDLVEPELRQAGSDFLRLDGSTTDRGAVVSRFQQDADGPPVLLVSLKAGGTGLNLTAADNVFLLDPWWNPAVEDQAADRAHRIGQTKPVLIQRLVAADTVEERILALQAHKRDLAAAALSDTQRAASLTRDDLLALLQ